MTKEISYQSASSPLVQIHICMSTKALINVCRKYKQDTPAMTDNIIVTTCQHLKQRLFNSTEFNVLYDNNPMFELMNRFCISVYMKHLQSQQEINLVQCRPGIPGADPERHWPKGWLLAMADHIL